METGQVMKVTHLGKTNYKKMHMFALKINLLFTKGKGTVFTCPGNCLGLDSAIIHLQVWHLQAKQAYRIEWVCRGPEKGQPAGCTY
jgi:hypothetical protein